MLNNVYEDLQAGADYLEGEEKDKAQKLLRSMEKKREKKEKIKKWGGDLEAIAKRIDNV